MNFTNSRYFIFTILFLCGLFSFVMLNTTYQAQMLHLKFTKEPETQWKYIYFLKRPVLSFFKANFEVKEYNDGVGNSKYLILNDHPKDKKSFDKLEKQTLFTKIKASTDITRWDIISDGDWTIPGGAKENLIRLDYYYYFDNLGKLD